MPLSKPPERTNLVRDWTPTGRVIFVFAIAISAAIALWLLIEIPSRFGVFG